MNLGQHALRRSCDVIEALGRVHGAFRSEKKQARGVEITHILCENLAKELQNFRNFGAPCAERIAYTRPAFAAKNIVINVAAALGEVGSLFRSEKVRAWRRDHAKITHK